MTAQINCSHVSSTDIAGQVHSKECDTSHVMWYCETLSLLTVNSSLIPFPTSMVHSKKAPIAKKASSTVPKGKIGAKSPRTEQAKTANAKAGKSVKGKKKKASPSPTESLSDDGQGSLEEEHDSPLEDDAEGLSDDEPFAKPCPTYREILANPKDYRKMRTLVVQGPDNAFVLEKGRSVLIVGAGQDIYDLKKVKMRNLEDIYKYVKVYVMDLYKGSERENKGRCFVVGKKWKNPRDIWAQLKGPKIEKG
ncbi:hypothetical protein FA15DRAFT_710257 [Coprinopsis marcescibilis]|uniref:Uncharacterized protein n=1 Tax=Coprinopsis marcescibilis TaxID=230819 RepID=A0A5C3KEF6_COPMA|nr:hypothetical protein FA15DRAFT_710257 [Coprinopsis marcescibilis]